VFDALLPALHQAHDLDHDHFFLPHKNTGPGIAARSGVAGARWKLYFFSGAAALLGALAGFAVSCGQ
jgi:hypothetical protein